MSESTTAQQDPANEGSANEGSTNEEDALAAVTSQVKRLLARLVPVDDRSPTDRSPLKVELSAPRRNMPSYTSPVPYHVEGEDQPALPSEGDAWLQIWEMDRLRLSRWGGGEGDTHDERNQLVCSIPGLVVREEGDFVFRASGDPAPVRSAAPTTGSILLDLETTQGETSEVEVWLPEHESLLELVCVLRDRVNDSGMEDARAASGVLKVRNVYASARRQIEDEGGLTLSFVPAYPTANAANDPEQRNDAEFERQAAAVLGTRACFVVQDGTLTLGHTVVNGSADLPGVCEEVRAAVADALELSEPPKIATILLFGHGTRTRLRLNPAGYRSSGSLSPEACEDFVQLLEPHLSSEVTFALFACNNARGYRAGKSCGTADSSYGFARVGEIPGVDSLAWSLFRALTDAGTRRATVWGHTTTGHTTRNPLLRVISSWGVADFASVLLGARALSSAARRHYVNRFVANFETQTSAVAISRMRNANRLRALSALSARYLPWGPLGGRESDPSDPEHRPGAAHEVERVVADLRGLMVVNDTSPDPWSYEDDSKRVITGRDPEVSSSEPLVPHFGLSEFTQAELGSPLRLELSLLQALELLRVRGRSALKVEALLEGGAMVRLNLAPARRAAVLEVAKGLVDEGFLSGVWDVAERLWVSVGALEYDEELTWVSGARALEPGGLASQALITRSIPWEAVSVRRVRRSLCEAGQRLLDRGGTLGGVSEEGTKLRVQGPPEALLAAAQELVAQGWIDAVQPREDGVQLECSEGEEAPTSGD